MSEIQSTHLTVRDKIKVFHNLEDSLGHSRNNLSPQDRGKRKEIMSQLLGLQTEKEINYDKEELEFLVTDFFRKLGLEPIFNKIEVHPLPKNMFVNLAHAPILRIEEAMFQGKSSLLIKIIIIHELYHKFGQNMNPDMKEVKHLRDIFGQNSITEMDIDADVETFMCFKEKNQIDFKIYAGIAYDGLAQGHTSAPRIPKMIRFIGSLLSIYVSQKVGEKHLILPDLHEVEGGKNFATCISAGRKFATIPSLAKIAAFYCKPQNKTKAEFIEFVTEIFEEVHNTLSTQLRLPSLNQNHHNLNYDHQPST